MTSEEIKDSVSMRDVLQRYGLPAPNRAGFIACPFHRGDREPSMKIYPKDYNCFACGANGDIFSFVQEYEGISFREAFLELGGTYPDREQESDFARKRRKYERIKRRETARNRSLRVQAEKLALIRETRLLWLFLKLYEPLSDDWCECYNRLQLAEYRLQYLNEKR